MLNISITSKRKGSMAGSTQQINGCPSDMSQVSLRWLHQQGVVPKAKSFNKERMRENLEIFDWELSEEEGIFKGSLHLSRWTLPRRDTGICMLQEIQKSTICLYYPSSKRTKQI